MFTSDSFPGLVFRRLASNEGRRPEEQAARASVRINNDFRMEGGVELLCSVATRCRSAAGE